MTRYRKKPVVIDAIIFDLVNKMINIDEIEAFIGAKVKRVYDIDDIVKGIMITTLEGEHIASLGDYIIKGVKGEFYPCKPDVFKMTYEKIKIKGE